MFAYIPHIAALYEAGFFQSSVQIELIVFAFLFPVSAKRSEISSASKPVRETSKSLPSRSAINSASLSLDAYWRSKSKPYKIFFYATLDQIHKFTFGLEKNTDAYNEDEQKAVKRWMMRVAMQQAFEPRGDLYIYIADHQHIPVEQIIKYEVMDTD